MTPWTAAHQDSLSITNSRRLLKLSHWVGDAIQPFYPLLSPFPPALNLSKHHNLFKWVSSSHQVAQILELQLQHQSFQWTFRVDFLKDWLVWSPSCLRVFFKHQSSNASILWCSAFFMVQFSHLYMTTGKTIALTTWIISLLAKWCLSFLLHSLG